MPAPRVTDESRDFAVGLQGREQLIGLLDRAGMVVLRVEDEEGAVTSPAYAIGRETTVEIGVGYGVRSPISYRCDPVDIARQTTMPSLRRYWT